MPDFQTIITYFFGFAIAIFPTIGFVYQYRNISKQKSVGTFSILVCGVLILSSLQRIGFFIFQKFAVALLFQSIFMFITQIALLVLCIKTMNMQGYFQKPQKNKFGEEKPFQQSFWKWKYLDNYIYTISICAFTILVLAIIIRRYQLEVLGQGLGYAALFTDSCLMIPQLLENIKQERVKGISHTFVFLNTLQDILELLYVLIFSQPLQFIIFAILQVVLNVLLILQIIHYKFWKKQTNPEQQKKIVETRPEIQFCHHEEIISDHRIAVNAMHFAVDQQNKKPKSQDLDDKHQLNINQIHETLQKTNLSIMPQ